MNNNVILNMIRDKFSYHYGEHLKDLLDGGVYLDKWNECVKEVAQGFRDKGLEASAKEAEKWLEDR